MNDAAACRLCFFPSGGAAAGPSEFSGQTTPALSVRTSGTGRRETGAQIFQRPKAPHGAAIVRWSAGSLAKVGGQGEVSRGVVAVPLKKHGVVMCSMRCCARPSSTTRADLSFASLLRAVAQQTAARRLSSQVGRTCCCSQRIRARCPLVRSHCSHWGGSPPGLRGFGLHC